MVRIVKTIMPQTLIKLCRTLSAMFDRIPVKNYLYRYFYAV